MNKIVMFSILSLSIFSCSIPNIIVVELESKNTTNVIGNVVFTEMEDVVTMIAEIKNLEPGKHAIHLHEKSDCSSNDGKSTGGHWNPTLTNPTDVVITRLTKDFIWLLNVGCCSSM